MTRQYDNYADLITFSRSSSGTALRPVSYGDELVTNGTFDTDTSGWTLSSGGTHTVSSGELTIDRDGDLAVIPYITQGISTVVGNLYLLSFEVKAGSTFSYSVSLDGVEVITPTSVTTGTKTLTFVATETTTDVALFSRNSIASVLVLDNISVKEVLFDQPNAPLTLFNHPAGIPRIEYDADGNRLGLLIEESRTNLITYSEDFSNAAWGPWASGATIVDNALTGPDGTLSMSSITPATSSSGIIEFFPVSSGADYTLSVFAKVTSGEETNVTLLLYQGVVLVVVVFEFVDGVPSLSSGSGSIEDFGNGIYRLSMTITTASASNHAMGILSTKPYYAFGAQVEAGAFPTSYIPTSGATATRAADVASIPVSAFGYNQSEGTVVVEASTASTTQTNHTDLRIKDGSSLPLVSSGSRVGGSSEGTYSLYSPSTTILVNVSSVVTEGSTYKSAYRLADNDVAISVNGSTVATDTSVSFTSLIAEAVEIGDGYGYLNGHIKSIKYYPRRLTNAQLQELTT